MTGHNGAAGHMGAMQGMEGMQHMPGMAMPGMPAMDLNDIGYDAYLANNHTVDDPKSSLSNTKARSSRGCEARDGSSAWPGMVSTTPALAAADVGIAMGTRTDVAIESAGGTLLKGDLQGIVRARQLSHAIMSNIRHNLFFALIYNALGVPVAAGVLYPALGLLLAPIIAAAAMAVSSVSVIGNSLRLRSVKL